MKERMGTLSGQLVEENGTPMTGGGIVSFFSTQKGLPPLLATMHRVPDMIGRFGPDGKFSTSLYPGTYYMGVLIITDPLRKQGPPLPGELFYFARDGVGILREFSVSVKEQKDAGQVIASRPESFSAIKKLFTIEGRLIMPDGSPFAGGVVMVKSDMNSFKPDFVSQRTGQDGRFKIQIPPDSPYYLIGREQAVGQPSPGTYVGTYGSTKSISEGGTLPGGNARPNQPSIETPQIEGRQLGPDAALPKPISGKAGETLSSVDIMMFKVPVPGEQREKLQGTLGFGEEFRKKMDKIMPIPQGTNNK